MTLAIRPQEGPQTQMLRSPAEILIFGGAAGGGKTFSLLMAPLRYKNIPGFGCTIFRRNFNQIFAQGGLWDESIKIYLGLKGARPRYSLGAWQFNDEDGNAISSIKFAHIERDEDVLKWQGSQIACLCYDELTHFSEKTFFYMLSRNRSTCGVRPHVIATCNPDADSWVSKFISWWIDQNTGYPIPERSGKLRFFIRRDETLYWANTRKELWDKFNLTTEEEKAEPKSVTFIMSRLEDNKELLRVNPQYLANLKAMSQVERERLLYGNWKIKAAGGLYFKREQVEIIDTIPRDIRFYCRAWDLAATEDKDTGDPDYTAGVLMGIRPDKTVVVLDAINRRVKAGDVVNLIRNTAVSDRAKYGLKYSVRIPQDPGAAGKIVASSYLKQLAGFRCKAIPVTGSKELRATPFAAHWQNGNVQILSGEWNDGYFVQLESFPDSKHDDLVDASSDSFNELTSSNFEVKNLI